MMQELEEIIKKLEVKNETLTIARDKLSFEIKVIESQIKKIRKVIEGFNG